MLRGDSEVQRGNVSAVLRHAKPPGPASSRQFVKSLQLQEDASGLYAVYRMVP